MTETRTVTVERQIAHPPEKLWRALTQPHLIQEWLMKNDFAPQVDHSFTFTADWGSVQCKVLEVDPPNSLSYTWSAMGAETVVTFTLTPDGSGTHLRLEQSGFAPDRPQNYNGAIYGWGQFFNKLEQVLAKEEA